MAKLLYRVAHFARRRRGLVLGVWLLILAVAGAGAIGLSGSTSNQFTIPGTQSQEVLDQLKANLPEAAGASGRIVFAAPKGRTITSPDAQHAIQAVVDQVGRINQVAGAFGPATTKMISQPDQRIGLAQVQFSVPAPELTDQTKTAIKAATETATKAGLEVAYSQEIAGQMVAVGATEGIGVVIAALVLLMTFGSLVAAGLPLLTALVGVGVGIAGLFALTSVITMSSTAPVLAMMLGLAVGIDYALFIVHRHRKQVMSGMAVDESIARAIGTAGSAVFFAGLTVIIALVGLTIVGIPFLSVMGLAAAATVAIAVLVALTLVPAILGFVGKRIVSPKAMAKAAAEESTKEAFGYRWARGVARRPIAALVLIVVSLGALAIPAFSLQLGLPDDSTAPDGSPQQRANALVTEGFGAGFSGPLVVVATLPSGVDPKAATGALVGKLSTVPDVTRVVPAGMSHDQKMAVLQLIPSSGPSSEATKQLVATLRDSQGAIHAQTGSTIGVTGQTAINIDVSQKLSDALPLYLLVIVGLSLILLAVMFRSILVPLKATAGFLLTVAASIGAVVMVFQWNWFGLVSHGGPVISFLPILMTGILFGLAMDYEVFLVSGMRESYVHGDSPREAVIDGFGHSARVVTAAALIMTSVFLGFVFSADTVIKSMGFALAFGVLVDAFVIRMTLVPALMTLFGRAAWWFPRLLDRITPNVDVEGAALARHIEQLEQPERVPQQV
ncbi:MMPL family transporter [Actinocrispum wychmicini]|uniref:RND superfamily putative drug exporter n=1 Tax=Actinocrispum wychmicini TaxID=1213861 RepID=A0A4R2JLV6_9PSEU|nr:MMPL family transporter [Actinocrispum wychmicini]TCO55175.1 RND superfamily putative drug exporter [Actinocrispum wychmicini]